MAPSFDELWNAAQSGDAEAQYGLAAYYGQRGRARRALRWLQNAAAGGSADGQYTLACWHLQGLHVPPDWDQGWKLIGQAADNDHEDALCARAIVRLLTVGDAGWFASLGDVAVAASRGHAGAIRQIAMLALEVGEVDLARQFFLEAAARDDVASAWICKYMNGPPDPAIKSELFSLPPGKALSRPGATTIATPRGDAPAISDRLIKQLGKMKVATIPAAETKLEDPRISVCRNFMSSVECTYLIALSLPQLAPSQVFDPATGRTVRDPYRHSSDMRFWPLDQDLIIYRLNCRIAQFAGLPIENQEMLTVLRYAPGEEYKPHFDFLTDKAEIASAGQRVKTVLVYLNSGYEGGETNFPRVDIDFKGDVGDALIFDNVDPEGAPDQNTLHAGVGVSAGIKWLASKWIRDQHQPLYGRRG